MKSEIVVSEYGRFSRRPQFLVVSFGKAGAIPTYRAVNDLDELIEAEIEMWESLESIGIDEFSEGLRTVIEEVFVSEVVEAYDKFERLSEIYVDEVRFD